MKKEVSSILDSGGTPKNLDIRDKSIRLFQFTLVLIGTYKNEKSKYRQISGSLLIN